VDGIGDGYFYNGRWSSAVNAWGGPTSIACVNANFCVATTGGTSEWNGRTWSQPQDVDTAGQLDTVSCTSPSFCVAADTTGNVFIWNGSAWSAGDAIDPSTGDATIGNNEIAGVSCVGQTFCMAVDSGGKALTFNGSTWSKPLDIDGSIRLVAVSCATTSFCRAVDKDGRILSYN
jgi:hypothetical protein